MASDRHLSRLAVYVLLINEENKILMIRRFNTGYRDGQYTLPAGHVEAGESLLQTALREINEEVLISVDVSDLQLVHSMQRHENSVDVVDFYFKARRWHGTPSIGEPHKADDIQWLSEDDAEEKALPFITQALRHIQEGVTYSSHGI